MTYVDEDIITLAFSAASKLTLTGIDGVLFATNSPVFTERYHASYLADLLELPQAITALDFGTSPRSGTDALIMADLLITTGKCKNILLVACDVAYPKIGKETFSSFGHAAVAMTVSDKKGLATITNTQSLSAGLAESFNYKGGLINYDTRFSIERGFKNNFLSALKTVQPEKTDCLIINSVYSRAIKHNLIKMGFEKQIYKDKVLPQCGYTGSSHALLQLITVLEEKIGSCVLMDYYNGTNVISINISSSGTSCFEPAVAQTEYIKNYQDYLAIRKAGNWKSPSYKPVDMFSSEMITEREKAQIHYLKGQQCVTCNTTYYLPAARCNHCKGTEFKEVRLAKHGIVYTMTNEHYFPSTFPPVTMLVIDLDGGGRITLQQTDNPYNEVHNLKIGDKVQLVLRKMLENDSKPNYFWKAIPKINRL